MRQAWPIATQGHLPARLEWALLDGQGIRPIWRYLLFVVASFGFGLMMAYIGQHLGHPPKGEIPPRYLVVSGVLLAWVVSLATAVMAWVEGQRFTAFGLADRDLARHALLGFAGGLLSLSALVAMLVAAGGLSIDGVALHGAAILANAAIMALVFVLVGYTEEMLMRGYLLRTLTQSMGFWPACAISSALFTLAHLSNDGETSLGLAGVFAAGVLFCVLVRETGSLWTGIGFHAAWDWAQSFLYGVPDSGTMLRGHLLTTHAMGQAWISGGPTGPEGSVLAAPVMLLGLAGMVAVLRRLRGAPVWAAVPAQ